MSLIFHFSGNVRTACYPFKFAQPSAPIIRELSVTSTGPWQNDQATPRPASLGQSPDRLTGRWSIHPASNRFRAWPRGRPMLFAGHPAIYVKIRHFFQEIRCFPSGPLKPNPIFSRVVALFTVTASNPSTGTLTLWSPPPPVKTQGSSKGVLREPA